MHARLASRRFYLARAPTPSHKSTLPSPAYSPPSIVSFLPTPPSLLIGRSDSIVRHFFSPWRSCNRCTARLPPISPLHQPKTRALRRILLPDPVHASSLRNSTSISATTWNLIAPFPFASPLAQQCLWSLLPCLGITHERAPISFPIRITTIPSSFPLFGSRRPLPYLLILDIFDLLPRHQSRWTAIELPWTPRGRPDSVSTGGVRPCNFSWTLGKFTGTT